MTSMLETGETPTVPASAPGAARFAIYFWPLALAWLALRLFFDSRPDLVPDEAFYWAWTRHLACGYFDHPPMIAWLMWLSTRVFGNTAFAVRLPAALLAVGALAVLFMLAKTLVGDSRAVGFVVAMWLAGPLLAVTGTIHTPDAPATFFSVCALACAVLIANRDDHADTDLAAPFAQTQGPRQGKRQGKRGQKPFMSAGPRKAHLSRFLPAGKWGLSPFLWAMFGVFVGLALLSKYTSILVPGGVGLALLTSQAGRRHLARPWVYLAAIIALAVFSPVIFWNATHHWASFLFQLHHGTGGEITDGVSGFFPILMARLGGLGEFFGGQMLVWTPILFGIAVFVIWVNWRGYSRLRNTDRMLLWCGTLPLVFFGWAATRSHGEMNWPAFAYFPLSLLIGRYLAAKPAGNRVQWVRKGCEVALGFTIALHLLAVPQLQQMLLRHGVPLPHQATDLWGWSDFGRQLADRAGGARVVCNRYGDAGEAAFYMPGQPDVWCEGVGSRPTAYDYFDRDRPEYARLPRVFFVGGHVDLFMQKFGYTRKTVLPPVVMPGLGKHRGRGVAMVEK